MARTFRVHVIIPSEFRVALVVTLRLFEMFARFFFVILLCFFLSFSSRFFLFSISFEQNRVLAVLGLWKGDMCSKGCGLYFSKGFFIRNNYVGSGFQAELEASSRFILFFLSIISFPFFFIDSLACFYYSSRSGTIIEKVEKVAS